MHQFSKSNGISPRFLSLTLLITLSIITFLCLRFMTRFCSLDLRPSIHSFDENFQNRSKTEVNVGFSIIDLIEFDTIKNKFVISGLLSFYFDPKYISLEDIEKFSFEKGVIDYKSVPFIYDIGDKKLARYNIKLSFKNNMYYGFFPFEDHKLYVALDNNILLLKDVSFRADNSNLIVNRDAYISGWQYRGQAVYEGYTTNKINISDKITEEVISPRVIFEIDYFHHSMRYLYLVILPLLLIFIIEIFTFSLDQERFRTSLFDLSLINIGALFAYRFVIQTISPNVGYLTISDYIFLLFLSTSFITFLINCIGLYMTQFQRKIAAILMQLYVIIVFILTLEALPLCAKFLFD